MIPRPPISKRSTKTLDKFSSVRNKLRMIVPIVLVQDVWRTWTTFLAKQLDCLIKNLEGHAKVILHPRYLFSQRLIALSESPYKHRAQDSVEGSKLQWLNCGHHHNPISLLLVSSKPPHFLLGTKILLTFITRKERSYFFPMILTFGRSFQGCWKADPC